MRDSSPSAPSSSESSSSARRMDLRRASAPSVSGCAGFPSPFPYFPMTDWTVP